MMSVAKLFSGVVAVVLAGLPLVSAAGEVAAPAAATFYRLAGDWQGEGNVSENGQQTHLALHLGCGRAADGWAVLCTMSGSDHDGNGVLAETDLFGVDPVSGTSHWYAVNNAGETHDHLVSWSDPATMRGSIGWQQDGKDMAERIVFEFPGADSLNFRAVSTANGQEVSVFSGSLRRQ